MVSLWFPIFLPIAFWIIYCVQVHVPMVQEIERTVEVPQVEPLGEDTEETVRVVKCEMFGTPLEW